VTTTVVLILIGVVGVIVLFGVLSSHLDANTGVWAELARRYPAQPAEPDATPTQGTAWIGTRYDWEQAQKPIGCWWWIIFPLALWMWWRRGWKQRITVRARTDQNYLHLDLEAGVAGASKGISIPWAHLDLEGRTTSHLGDMALFAVEQYVLLLPVTLVEDEVAVREQLARDEQPPTPDLPHPRDDAENA